MDSMTARPVIRLEPFRDTHPIAHRVWWWRKHCEETHGATEASYRSDVLGWHSAEHPDCDATYG